MNQMVGEGWIDINIESQDIIDIIPADELLEKLKE